MSEVGDAKEVRCRCGERVLTAPSPSVRCPACGRRLFRQCTCGMLIERRLGRCPYCGSSQPTSSRSNRPPLRLRSILAAGFLGALVFTFLGYGVTKVVTRLLGPHPDPSSVPSQPPISGNPISLTVRGIGLLIADLWRFVQRAITEQPIVLAFAVVGFLIMAGVVARRQQFSFRRLRRHLRRRWQELLSRWL